MITGIPAAVGADDTFISQDTAATTTTSVTIAWVDIGQYLVQRGDAKSCVVDSYQLEWGLTASSTLGTVKLAPATHRYTITGLKPSTRYHVRVKWTGSGVWANGRSFIIAVPEDGFSMNAYTQPATVSKFLKYNYGHNQKGLQVTWTIPESENAYPNYEYQIVNTKGKVIKSGLATKSGFTLSSFSGYKQVTRIRVRGYYKFYDSATQLYGPWSGWKNLVPQPIVSTFLSLRFAGTFPASISCASPSTIAVLPTPGSPTRQTLFFTRLERICITLLVSLSLPITGSRLPLAASALRFLLY